MFLKKSLKLLCLSTLMTISGAHLSFAKVASESENTLGKASLRENISQKKPNRFSKPTKPTAGLDLKEEKILKLSLNPNAVKINATSLTMVNHVEDFRHVLAVLMRRLENVESLPKKIKNLEKITDNLEVARIHAEAFLKSVKSALKEEEARKEDHKKAMAKQKKPLISQEKDPHPALQFYPRILLNSRNMAKFEKNLSALINLTRHTKDRATLFEVVEELQKQQDNLLRQIKKDQTRFKGLINAAKNDLEEEKKDLKKDVEDYTKKQKVLRENAAKEAKEDAKEAMEKAKKEAEEAKKAMDVAKKEAEEAKEAQRLLDEQKAP